jgi:hypothetical protein
VIFQRVGCDNAGNELVDRILAAYEQKRSTKNKGMSANHNQLQEKILLAIVVTWLDRLL